MSSYGGCADSMWGARSHEPPPSVSEMVIASLSIPVYERARASARRELLELLAHQSWSVRAPFQYCMRRAVPHRFRTLHQCPVASVTHLDRTYATCDPHYVGVVSGGGWCMTLPPGCDEYRVCVDLQAVRADGSFGTAYAVEEPHMHQAPVALLDITIAPDQMPRIVDEPMVFVAQDYGKLREASPLDQLMVVRRCSATGECTYQFGRFTIELDARVQDLLYAANTAPASTPLSRDMADVVGRVNREQTLR